MLGACPNGAASVDEARFLASFFACLSSRRSRSLLSRLSFAIVVFFFPREAMDAVPLLVEDAMTGIRQIDNAALRDRGAENARS